MSKRIFGFCAATGLTLGLSAGTALAGSVDVQTMLGQFNLIALNDMNASTHVQGTAYVGGNLTAMSGGYFVNSNGLPDGRVGHVSGGLIVGGNVQGDSFNSNGQGNIVVGGSVNNSGGLPVDGGETLTAGIGANRPGGVPVNQVAGLFQALSTGLAGKTATPGSGTDMSDHNNLLIAQGNPAHGTSIVHAENGFLTCCAVNQKFGPDFDASLRTVVNVPGEHVVIGTNLDGLQFSRLLFNFYEARSLTLNTGVAVSLLAPFADVIVRGGGTKGTLVGYNVMQYSEIRPFDDHGLYDGDIAKTPLPAAGWLLLAAIGGTVALRRRTG